MKSFSTLLIFCFTFLGSPMIHGQVWIQSYSGSSISDTPTLTVDGSGNVYVTSSANSDYVTIKYDSSGIQQWVRSYNGLGNGSDQAFSIAVDDSGNVYVTGKSDGSGTGTDYATIKYNSMGVQKWIKRYNGPGNSDDGANVIAVDRQGNVYVTGTSVGNGTGQDYATIKYNSVGSIQWLKRYNGLGNNDLVTSMAVDDSGNVYVTGFSYNNANVSDCLTIKYNSNGDSVWVKRYDNGSTDAGRSLSVDNFGNVYVTGYCYDDCLTIKYNSNGDSLWVRRYSAGGVDEGLSLFVDNIGNVYVTGYSSGDYVTIKYNTNGDTLWVRRYNGQGNGSDVAKCIAGDDFGNVCVTGYSYLGSTNYDYVTIKYSSLGAQIWVQTYNGATNSTDGATFVAVDRQGFVYVTGQSYVSNSYYIATMKYSPGPLVLNLTALIEGFYDNNSNTMVIDTVRAYLRNVNSPYLIVDYGKSVLNPNGNATFMFSDSANGVPYYVVIEHRNSIQTWSKQGEMFISSQLTYDFTSSANNAYGNNLVLKGNKYCIYGGDVNQSGSVDLTDIILTYNDALNSGAGYITTDLNGDYFVDVSDIIIAFNNSSNFVSIARP